VLAECSGVDDYTRFCTVLTAYSESDFRSDAVQRDPETGEAKSFGCFQQTPKYWPTAHGTTAEQCRAFLADFRAAAKYHNGDPVHDCWITQRWSVPGSKWPDPGPQFAAERLRSGSESENYQRRLPLIDSIIRERQLP
jgi:hypothetical protein